MEGGGTAAMYVVERMADGEAGVWKVGWRNGEGRKSESPVSRQQASNLWESMIGYYPPGYNSCME